MKRQKKAQESLDLMTNNFKTEFDPLNHIGKVNGVMWPSVTQILQEYKLIDYSGVDPVTLENKRLLGIRVHAASVMVDDGSLDEEHFNKSFPECIPYLDGYRKFRVCEKFEPLRKEERYFSKKWRFHGAPDESGIHIHKFGKDDCLIDYKTTFSSYPSHGNQLAAYTMLILECLGIKIKKRFSLLLKKTGNYDLVPFKDPRDQMEFQACLILHWSRREKHKTMNEKNLIEMYSN